MSNSPVMHHQAHGIHPGAFMQSTQPDVAALGLQDHVLWIDTTTGPPYVLKVWHAAANTWEIVGATGSTTDQFIQDTAPANPQAGWLWADTTGNPTNPVLKVWNPAYSIPAYQDRVMALDPLAYWRLGDAAGASSVADSSGHNRTGTLIGTPAFGNAGGLPNETATCALFDGASEGISFADASGLPTTGPYTLEALVYAIDLNMGDGFGTIVSYGLPNRDEMTGLLVRCNDSSLYDWWWFDDVSVPETDLVGKWHHVAVVYDGSTRKMYYDGNLVSTQSWNNHSGQLNNLSVGFATANGSHYWHGYLQEVAIYGAALSQSDISQHYQSMLYGPVTEGIWQVVSGPAGPVGPAGPQGIQGIQGPVGPNAGIDTSGNLSADCVVFPFGAQICNPQTDLVTITTPSGQWGVDPTGLILPHGHRLEVVQQS